MNADDVLREICQNFYGRKAVSSFIEEEVGKVMANTSPALRTAERMPPSPAKPPLSGRMKKIIDRGRLRYLSAVEMMRKGMTDAEVAREMTVAKSTACDYRRAAIRNGDLPPIEQGEK